MKPNLSLRALNIQLLNHFLPSYHMKRYAHLRDIGGELGYIYEEWNQVSDEGYPVWHDWWLGSFRALDSNHTSNPGYHICQ